MLEMYYTDIKTNLTEKVTEFKKGNWINMVAPTEEEIKEVCTALEIQEDFIRYALDYEEKARIDMEAVANTAFFIEDCPIREKEGDSLIYSQMYTLQYLMNLRKPSPAVP